VPGYIGFRVQCVWALRDALSDIERGLEPRQGRQARYERIGILSV
jgi:hypothetical protein